MVHAERLTNNINSTKPITQFYLRQRLKYTVFKAR